MAVSDHVAWILGPPGQPLAGRLLATRDLGDRCGPDDWPALRDAVKDPATHDEIVMGALEAVYAMHRRGVVTDDDVRPLLDAVAAGRDDWCGSQAVQLLAAVPTGWAVDGLDRYVGPGWLGQTALRALAGHRHLTALTHLRRHATGHDHHEARRTAGELFDQQVGHAMRLAVVAEDTADGHARVFAALLALGAWADVLILLRAGHGDDVTRAALRELPAGTVPGRGGARLLRGIKSAAGRP